MNFVFGKTLPFPNRRHCLSHNKEYLLKKNPHGTAVGIIVHLFINSVTRTYVDRRGKRTHDQNEEVVITITELEKATLSVKSGCVPGLEGGIILLIVRARRHGFYSCK